jgi:hypothetical protein
MHTLTYYSGKAGKSYYCLYAFVIQRLTDSRKVNYIDRRIKSVLDLVALGFSTTLAFSLLQGIHVVPSLLARAKRYIQTTYLGRYL